MIDLHSHILPGLDDGPDDLEGAMALARAAAEDGTRVIAATPHLRRDFPRVLPDDLHHQVAALGAELIRAGVTIDVIPGGEVDILWAAAADDDALRLVTYRQHGADMLLETPHGPLPDFFEDAVFNISVRGPRVVLAHPERNPTFQREPNRLAAFVERGGLVQVAASSLTARHAHSRSRRLALELLDRRLAHAIASDAHGIHLARPPGLSQAVAEASKIDPVLAEWLVTDGPAAILAGDPVSPPSALRRPRALARIGRRLVGRS